VLHVAFDGSDEVRDEVIAFFEHDINGAEYAEDEIFPCDEGVENDDGDENEQDYKGNYIGHIRVSFTSRKAPESLISPQVRMVRKAALIMMFAAAVVIVDIYRFCDSSHFIPTYNRRRRHPIKKESHPKAVLFLNNQGPPGLCSS